MLLMQAFMCRAHDLEGSRVDLVWPHTDAEPSPRPLQESPHPKFQREGNDLIYTRRLPLADALCGTTVSLTTLDGRPLSVPVKEVSPLLSTFYFRFFNPRYS